VVDAALVTLGIGLTPLAVKTPWSPLPRTVIACAGLAGSLAVWWHRRHPAAVTMIGAVAQVLSGSAWPLLVGLFSAARLRSRWLPVIACVATVAFGAPRVLEGDPVRITDVVGAALQTAAVLATGAYVGARHALVDSLRDRAERAEAERHLRAEQARAGERTRIAREMHDLLAHKMSLIALHAGALEVDPAADPAKVEQTATLIGATAREALDELRWVLGLLRGDGAMAGASGLPERIADVGQLVSSWQQAGMDVSLRDDAGHVPAAIERAVYRTVQEGLTNASKHAPGAPVTVTLAGGHGAAVTVAVVNGPADGAGDPGLPGAGTGLVGLAERLRLVRGTLSSGRDTAGGWALEARIAWPDGRDGASRTRPADRSTR
jgi:signal transduction histidine kinase